MIGLTPADGESTVKCGSCKVCCSKELVVLVEGDDPRLYPEAQTIPMPHPFTGAPFTTMLPHKEDGTCVYLGENGCTIYDKRPRMCLVFSCVGFVARVRESVPRAQWRRDLKDGVLDREIWDAGVERTSK